MEARPQFLADLGRLGAKRGRACFNCGNCSAICPLSETNPFYPRQVIRYAQLGVQEKILGSPAIWLCYHCVECTSMCPREADPGEVIMALRRWAIARYNWLGALGEKLYTSPLFCFLFCLGAALGAALVLWRFHGPLDLKTVHLHEFLPTGLIDVCGLSLGAFVLVSLFLNLSRMAAFYREQGYSFRFDLGELLRTFWEEVVLQNRYQKCEDRSKWAMHLALVNGFIALGVTTALAFVLNPEGDPAKLSLPVRLLGTLGGFSLVFGCLMANWRRLTGREAYSHFTDWIFLELVLLAGLTGLILELFLYLNLPLASYLLYALHLIVVFLLILATPYSKFAHALYRFLALCVARAQARQSRRSAVRDVR